MKQIVAAVATLAFVVAGIVLATSMTSSAQESGDSDADTTTTIPEDDALGFFDFRFDSDLPAELEELKSCLAEQGLDVPDRTDRSFRFELRGTEGLAEALEACGVPDFGARFPFGGTLFQEFPFDGELPEGFPFDGELPEGFPFDGELPEGFPFGGSGEHFGFGGEILDRDELASCLAELGSFESVDEVRAQLDECLPEHPMGLGDFKGFGFGGWFDFDFDSDPRAPVPDGSDSSA